jgi:phosphate transport system ATP-binding protein
MASAAKAPVKAKKSKSENKIEIKNFSFYYGEKRAIDNLNLNIRANQVTSIFGPANSGTTTLLRALNRLSDLNHDARMEGQILIDGQDINAHEINVTELRRKIGCGFEVPTPLPMSIYSDLGEKARAKSPKRWNGR